MKDRAYKLIRTERRRGGVLLLMAPALLLAVFLPALCTAADTSESKPPDSPNSASPSKIDSQMAPTPTRHDDRGLDEKQQPKQGLAPQRNRASYPIVGQGSRDTLRSLGRARSDFDRSMRSLNDSMRRANDAINRIRSLRKF
jgi:hypothetical protein